MREEFEIRNNVLIIYNEKDGITDAVIPEGIIKIGSAAFSYCESLTNIIIPDSVTQIGNFAFIECTNLTEITLPESLTIIGSAAFTNCNNLKTVNIPSYEIFNMLDDYSKVVAFNTIIRDKKQEQYSKEDINKFKKYIVENKMNIFKSILENSNLMDLFYHMLKNKIYTNEELNTLIGDITENNDINPEIIGILLEYKNNNSESKDIESNINDRFNLDDDKDINEEEENENKRR